MRLLPFTPDARGPLAGVRVVDLSRLVAGNLLTLQLADFGAEVIKVEPPEGDTLRGWLVRGIPTAWKVYARNKKSVALDLRDDTARDLVGRLAGTAHVFVESFRPGVLEAMGLAPATLLERNPGLVIVRISGFGQDGPYSQRPGFGTLVEGMSGFASMNGFADREPVLPPMYLADSMAGLYGATAVLMALREVEVNGGTGQVIDLPLLDPLFSTLGAQAANYQLTGRIKERTGSRSTNSMPRNVYRTSDDRWVCLSASTQPMAMRVLRAIGRAELCDDPRYATNAARLENALELDAIIAAFVGARTQAENVAYFERVQVTIGPVYDIAQIMDDPHFAARDILVGLPDEAMGTVPMHNVVPRLGGTPGAIRTPAPRLGEHNEEVFAPLGLSSEDLARLRADGILCSAE